MSEKLVGVWGALHYLIGISKATYTYQWCIHNYTLYEIQPTGQARRLA